MVWQLPCVIDDSSNSGSSAPFRKINNKAFPEIVIEAAEEAGDGTAANSLASSSLDLVPVSERLKHNLRSR